MLRSKRQFIHRRKTTETLFFTFCIFSVLQFNYHIEMTIATGMLGGFIFGILTSLSLIIEEEAARLLLMKIEERNQELVYSYHKARWNYEVNITDYNLDIKNNLENQLRTQEIMDWKELSRFDWKRFKDEDLKRQFTLMKKAIGVVQTAEELSKIQSVPDSEGGKPELSYVLDEMFNLYSKSDTSEEVEQVKRVKNHKKVFKKVSVNKNQWQNDLEINKWISESTSGKKIKEFYKDYVYLVNRDARQNRWFDIFSHTVPYANKHSVEVTQEMIKQGYTPLKMFKTADEFFVSLNMSAVPDTFWENSILEEPDDDRDFNCIGTAWDLSNKKDFRISMCTDVNQIDLEGAHHEMGHIQYYMQYKDLPSIYRRGPNSGFHEAIGDVIAMSVVTPKHLKLIRLLPSNFEFDQESSINFLFNQALNRIMDLPYIYVVEKWRWSVFRGEITEENYNCHYWKLRAKYQGVQPPVDRSENDFEPGTIFQVAANEPYISYFVSAVLQFQFHKALCIAAGEYDPDQPDKNPLYNCDIYNSSAAGEKLSKMLRLGASKPWPDVLEAMTGSRKMSSDDLLEYYKPLNDWLKKENQLRGYKVGWGKSTVNSCKKS